MLAAKQGGHLDFGSHCTVLDLPDPELFSSQTCCWCICRKRTIIFCAITKVPKNHQSYVRASLCKLLLALFQQGYRLALWWSDVAEDWRTTLGGEVTAVVSVWYLPWHGTVVFHAGWKTGCGAGIAEECDGAMILGNWGHGEGQFHLAFCRDLVHVQGPV